VFGGFFNKVINKSERMKETERRINNAKKLYKKIGDSSPIKLKGGEEAKDYIDKVMDEMCRELNYIEDEGDRTLSYLIVMDKKISWFWNKDGKISINPSEELEGYFKDELKKQTNTPTAMDFEKALQDEFSEAKKRGEKGIVICAGDFHKKVGGYPGPNHRMPICCDVMKKFIKSGDAIIKQPPKGTGASLTIYYFLKN